MPPNCPQYHNLQDQLLAIRNEFNQELNRVKEDGTLTNPDTGVSIHEITQKYKETLQQFREQFDGYFVTREVEREFNSENTKNFHTRWINSVSLVTYNGEEHILSSGGDKRVLLTNLASGEVVREFNSENTKGYHIGWIHSTSLVTYNDQEYLLSTGSDGRVLLTNLASREVEKKFIYENTENFLSLRFTPPLSLLTTTKNIFSVREVISTSF